MGSTAPVLEDLPAFGRGRQLNKKPWQRLSGFQAGGPSESAEIRIARSSQSLVYIGQAYFIKRSLIIYNY